MDHKAKRAAYRGRAAHLAHGKMLAERNREATVHMGYQGRPTDNALYLKQRHVVNHGTAPQTASEWRREQQSRGVVGTAGAWSAAKVSTPTMESDCRMKRFEAGRKPDAMVDRAARTLRITLMQAA